MQIPVQKHRDVGQRNIHWVQGHSWPTLRSVETSELRESFWASLCKFRVECHQRWVWHGSLRPTCCTVHTHIHHADFIYSNGNRYCQLHVRELRWTTSEMDGQDTVKVLVSSRNRTSERRPPTSCHHCRPTATAVAKTASQSQTASTYECLSSGNRLVHCNDRHLQADSTWSQTNVQYSNTTQRRLQARNSL